jgi:hypothetical protein
MCCATVASVLERDAGAVAVLFGHQCAFAARVAPKSFTRMQALAVKAVGTLMHPSETRLCQLYANRAVFLSAVDSCRR